MARTSEEEKLLEQLGKLFGADVRAHLEKDPKNLNALKAELKKEVDQIDPNKLELKQFQEITNKLALSLVRTLEDGAVRRSLLEQNLNSIGNTALVDFKLLLQQNPNVLTPSYTSPTPFNMRPDPRR